jgi:recombinational DNA repair protein (RecF pathway)
MYHKHTTHAFVLNISPSGEKNNFITLFTREFGMIRAKAQSVRVVDSKLRYALQEYSYVEASFVKGKDIWRITNALPIYNIYFELKDKQNIFMSIARIFSLLKRLIPDEGCEALIFNDLEIVCENARSDKYSKNTIEILEWLFVLRTLYFLGYVHKENFQDLCGENICWDDKYLETIAFNKDNVIYAINNALKASNL